MKTKKQLIAGIAITMLLGAIYTGCGKKVALDTDTSSAEDNSTAENAMNGVFNDVSKNSDTVKSFRSNSCSTLTLTIVPTMTGTVTGFPKTITIDYGSGCNANGGVIKKGIIKAVFSGPFRDSGSVITVTYINYYHGDFLVNATSHTITNKGPVSAAKNFVYEIDLTGGSLVSSAGTISWNSTKSIEWSQGILTSDSSDDVFLVSGSTTGTSSKGSTYTAVINTPLKIATACDYIESGVLTLTPTGKDPRVIDFGNTGCDNQATVTFLGNTYDISM